LLHAHSLEFTYKEIPYHVISKEDFVTQCFDAMKVK
jgi:hypothetical protein